jgi:hypothetical protein
MSMKGTTMLGFSLGDKRTWMQASFSITVIRKFNDRCNNNVTEKLTIDKDEANVRALG